MGFGPFPVRNGKDRWTGGSALFTPATMAEPCVSREARHATGALPLGVGPRAAAKAPARGEDDHQEHDDHDDEEELKLHRASPRSFRHVLRTLDFPHPHRLQ
jgi:hypothetical protein